MDATTRAFIYASLLYLALGALLGLGVGVAPETFLAWRFVHVHLLLLGFMAMMVYGVGYFILPRFNVTTLRWPHLLPVHFWTANLGLLGICHLRRPAIAGRDERAPAVRGIRRDLSVVRGADREKLGQFGRGLGPPEYMIRLHQLGINLCHEICHS